MKLWEEGSINDLLYESQTIQERLKSDWECTIITKILLKLKNLMG